ncbi:phosphoenolpyruvate carboxykinase (ATP) [Aeoliella mucimassa]|uniref:Phosphoenolpyruvate carboxykinase (ATP) n=1 Tax=Aeoliella mucimassa TaxID=2527972 RepID=A0A518AST0_9BACT|nr:phosphoenolpyruvate carboxykinase (ATP) [Aeoliella mucimassa]QDU57774.1 Phosphoenolpyruvate carboxykinase [ATP] [Aeoliella mucimassa]
MNVPVDLSVYGITVKKVLRNLSPAELCELGVETDGEQLTSSGAINANSGAKKGRSPKDKRVVKEASSDNDVWWGNVNIPFTEDSFGKNRKMAIDYLNTCDQLFVLDGYAGWEPENQIKVRVICSRSYHALFMHNMLIRPTKEQLESYGEPDYVVFNAGCTEADPSVEGVENTTSVALNFAAGEFVILGSQYAGEMKKGVFTIMNYLMPKKGILSMHCSANEGPKGDVSLFFGLSGTGKTTLSADVNRALIGDDEHCWSETGVSNIEGGCYAKTINLSAEKEPEIYGAIKFGTVLENVIVDPETREVDYDDVSLTENTRASYPIEHIPNAKIPCIGGHPKNIVFLTCDAFGVLPPVSKLTPEQAMYHFISGYTAKVAGTEVGVTEPEATFSACFGAPFLVWHPSKYAELLAEKMRSYGATAWLVNTGWSGGAYGTGERMSLKYTRAIIDAIHDGTLVDAPTATDPVFGVEVPTECANVPSEILVPKNTWADKEAFEKTAGKLASLFVTNFKKFEEGASDEIKAAGPNVEAAV